MAVAKTRTLLSLDRFAAVLGIHPLHFNGVYHEDLAPAATCGQPFMQYAWQAADAVGREDIAQAVSEAEALITQWSGFKPAPTWEADERQLTLPTRLSAVTKTNYGHFIAGGVEKWSSIEDGVAVTYSDVDGDGYKELATITVTVAITEADEIAIVYPGKSGAPEWEVRPTNVSITGTTATITCSKHQLVKDELFESLASRGVDGSTDAAFLATVDVYRHYHDPSQQIQLLWRAAGSTCGCCSCAQCMYEAQFGCITSMDYQTGLISGSSADWDADSESYVNTTACVQNRPPDHVRLWYRAGFRNMKLRHPDVIMDSAWERAIAFLALKFLDRPLCACSGIRDVVGIWQEDLALQASSGSGSRSFKVGKAVLDNPLGTTRGAVHAWRMIQNHRVLEALSYA